MRLIDDKDVLPKIDEAFLNYAEHDDVLRLYSDARLAVINAPTIDPASLRPKGEWVMDAKKHCHCSCCNDGRNIATQIGWNYCPNCGADMRPKEAT